VALLAGTLVSEDCVMTPGQVELRAEWCVLPQQVSAVTAAVYTVLAETRREQGCLTCSLSTDMGEYATLRLAESWDSEDSLRRHVRSPRFEALAGVMESAFAPPRVEFVLPGGTRGLEYAHSVRHGHGSAR
jgi:quinol monooxygenase YgiN